MFEKQYIFFNIMKIFTKPQHNIFKVKHYVAFLRSKSSVTYERNEILFYYIIIRKIF